MRKHPVAIAVGAVALVAAVAGIVLVSGSRSVAGPYGGDVVALDTGQGKAELLANADSGEVMVHTWDNDLKAPEPIESQPITVGSGDQSVTLDPHPTQSDPPGYCSRFYGRADWVRGGGVRHGWIRADGAREDFAWNRCWSGGRQHGAMWTEMGEHAMGMRHGGPGMHHGGRGMHR
jgi:hypothetical protein